MSLEQMRFPSVFGCAAAAVKSPCLGIYASYHYALAGACLVLLLFVENTVKQQMLRYQLHSRLLFLQVRNVVKGVQLLMHGCRRMGLLREAKKGVLESWQMVEDNANKLSASKNIKKLMTEVFLEGGLVCHSIFAGITYGASRQGVPFMAALIFHQAN